jgi:hypothetical protein
MNEFSLIDYSPWLFLVYFILQGIIPGIRKALEMILPEHVKRRKNSEEKLIDLQEKELDIQERNVVANEQIAAALVLIQNNQNHFSADVDYVKRNLSEIKSRLGYMRGDLQMLLDRNMRMRSSDYKTGKDNDKSDGERLS